MAYEQTKLRGANRAGQDPARCRRSWTSKDSVSSSSAAKAPSRRTCTWRKAMAARDSGSPVELVYARGLTRAETRRIRELTSEHAEDFLEKWRHHFDQ